MQVYIRAEPMRNEHNTFIHKQVIFTILRQSGDNLEQWDTFTREQIRQFYNSRSDNRTMKLSLQNKRRDGYDDFKLVFQNVHKLFQFAALVNIRDDYPTFRPIRDVAANSDEEVKGEATAIDNGLGDLKVLSITWNMGGAHENVWLPE